MGAWQNNFSRSCTSILKVIRPCTNGARFLLLIHGLSTVYAREIIAIGTAFYAIIYRSNIIFHAITFARYQGRFSKALRGQGLVNVSAFKNNV